MKTKKMYLVLFSFITLSSIFINCRSDDDKVILEEGETPNQPDKTVNQAPDDFELIAVIDGATDVDVMPNFLWNAAVDPEGDSISYELFVDENSNPTTSLANTINETNFTLEERLPLNQDLFWKVVANDSEGNETSSETFSFTTRNLQIPETPVTENAAFSERTDHTSVVFDNKIWVIGGYDGFSYLNDIWQSSDGETWTQITAEAPFHRRSGHTSVVFNNEIYVIGGFTGVDFLRDIWKSSDGETWAKITGASPFPQNGLHSAVVFKDKLWVIGSLDESAKLSNNIWQSSDGEMWTPVDVTVSFPERYGHTTMVYDDKIWIIGGSTFNGLQGVLDDVWQSADGREWIKVTEETAIEGRTSHANVVFDNKMWLIGGRDSRLNQNDIYQSIDGITWSQRTEEVSFTERRGHTCVVFDDKIWVIGGRGGILADSYLNDVWLMN
ncbi:kelch repeat-containing protein [Maribacter sp. 1_MG-2023]|uniref:Kelch repeat-containing protein n=1 Tax=Maribacter sp. 1_MG-2023 TaxID=3062677 RepID=UPI0026E22AFB|nr:kelch repeat-containing protein [Maribacter sp. 1_MG-2023]MDO6472334.1 kelch repeat-containing protein [Maribacter sp. 1_MG-2023]